MIAGDALKLVVIVLNQAYREECLVHFSKRAVKKLSKYVFLHHIHSRGYQIALNIPAISYNASITGDIATNIYDLISKLLFSLSLCINA